MDLFASYKELWVGFSLGGDNEFTGQVAGATVLSFFQASPILLSIVRFPPSGL
jgi:hypothetical protein